MSVWFEGTNDIACDIQQAKLAAADPGEYFAAIVRLLPGMTSVDLVEQDADSVTIRTNEGLMVRSGISTREEPDGVVMEFDEQYQAGSRVTVNTHFMDEFTASDSGMAHRLVMSNVAAPGFLGFFYRKFGGSKMGKGYLTAYKAHFERRTD